MMSDDKKQPDSAAEYQNLLNLLARTLKYLEGINADPAVLKSYKHLLRYLRTRSPATIAEILGGPNVEKHSRKHEAEPSEDEILAMAVQQIMELAADPKISRRSLEKIAIVRFGMTKGGVSALRSRDALVEKLRTLIRNESAHDSITRIASKRDRNES